MVLENDQVKKVYGRTAKFYDAALVIYRLAGIGRQRATSIDALNLRPGATVVDLGCGTGANLAMLVRRVGPTGRVVGIDLSPEMLAKARERVADNGWDNVELRCGDLRTADLPDALDGAVATFALEMLPDHAEVVARVADRLQRGARFACLGLKEPEHWPKWLIDLAIFINRPFGVSRDYAAIKPWHAIEELLSPVSHKEFLAGAAYRCVAEAIGPIRRTTSSQTR
tara:strand:+ start:604 stop:1281 length:678 start_codon:yes stop_codon:yes gene_type:complete